MGKNKRNNKQQRQEQQQTEVQAAASAVTAANASFGDGAKAKGKKETLTAVADAGAGAQSTSTNGNTTLNGNRATIEPETRKEISTLVMILLDKSQTVHANTNEEWQQYVEIQNILKCILLLEAPMWPVDATADDDQTRLAKIVAFEEWAKTGNGVQSESLEIAMFPGYQLGLRTTSDIAEQQKVLSVPRNLIFTEELMSATDRELFSHKFSNLNLANALMIEKLRGSQSCWHPYIEVLPARYNTVLYFTVEQMQSLRGTTAISSALRQCRIIARQYATLYKCVYMREASGLGKSRMGSVSVMLKPRGFCFELYRWAVSTVMTRQNMVPSAEYPKKPGISALIPYWDMANHKPGLISSYYYKDKERMECTADVAYAKGEQFFIFYGERCSADLLVHNGFVDVDNRKDSLNIKLGLNADDALAEQRERLLGCLRIERKAELRVLPAPEHISGELLAFVRIFNMSAEQLEHWNSDEQRAVDLLHIDCALETELERRTWQYLYQRLKLLLAVLDARQTAAQETQLLQDNSCQDIDRMILQYRRLERRMLTEALQYAQERCKV